MEDKTLGEVCIDKKTFELDALVSSRYQAFSSELLRISLLGIAGVGFMTRYLDLSETPSCVRLAAVGSLVALGASATGALLHRYFGPDSLAVHLEFLRMRAAGREPERVMAKRVERRSLFRLCKRLLMTSSIALAAGACLLILAFALRMWTSPT